MKKFTVVRMRKTVISLLSILVLQGVCRAAPAIMYVTPAGAGNKDGSGWANAFGLAEWYADISGSAEAGDTYFVAGGTYTLTGNWTVARAGSASAPIKIIGVKCGTSNMPPNASDMATEPNDSCSPTIVAGTYAFTFTANYWHFENLNLYTQEHYGFKIFQYNEVINCFSHNTSATTDYRGFTWTNYTTFLNCEGISDSGPAWQGGGTGHFIGCRMHDSGGSGVLIGGSNCTIEDCIIYGNVNLGVGAGINMEAYYNCVIKNNTIYNCKNAGIQATTGYRNTFVNNIISNCPIGAKWQIAAQNTNHWINNCFYNIIDLSNVTVEAGNLLATDPCFVDAVNNDFRLKPNSPCLNTGKAPLSGNPAIYNGYSNIGSWQGNSPSLSEVVHAENYVLAGDLDEDRRVDYFDFAIMASNWLIDCNLDPDNPECIQN